MRRHERLLKLRELQNAPMGDAKKQEKWIQQATDVLREFPYKASFLQAWQTWQLHTHTQADKDAGVAIMRDWLLKELHDLEDLEEASQPHWTTAPTFWIVVATLILTFLAWRFPRAPSDEVGHNPSLSAAMSAQSPPPPEPKSTAPASTPPAQGQASPKPSPL